MRFETLADYVTGRGRAHPRCRFRWPSRTGSDRRTQRRRREPSSTRSLGTSSLSAGRHAPRVAHTAERRDAHGRRVRVSLGLRYLTGGDVDYLTKGAIHRDEHGATFEPARSPGSMVSTQIGMAFEFQPARSKQPADRAGRCDRKPRAGQAAAAACARAISDPPPRHARRPGRWRRPGSLRGRRIRTSRTPGPASAASRSSRAGHTRRDPRSWPPT